MMRIWVLGFVTAVWAAGAWAEDVVLEPFFFASNEECKAVLKEFSEACVIYEGSMWSKVYAEGYGVDTISYWELTKGDPTPAYRYDIDGDGTEDMIVSFSFGFCKRGGTKFCDHKILFGDQPRKAGLPAYGIAAEGRPVLSERDRVPGIYFEVNSHLFHPMSEIREKTISSPYIKMEKN